MCVTIIFVYIFGASVLLAALRHPSPPSSSSSSSTLCNVIVKVGFQSNYLLARRGSTTLFVSPAIWGVHLISRGGGKGGGDETLKPPFITRRSAVPDLINIIGRRAAARGGRCRWDSFLSGDFRRLWMK